MRYAESAAELMSLDKIASMSGLDFLTGILEGRYPAPPIGQTMNFHMHAVEEGSVTFRGIPTFSVMNPIGTIHGGWFGTLLDSCMACAVQSRLPAGMVYTTLEFGINIVRPLLDDSGPVLAIGTTTHVGRRTGLAEGRIIGEADGKLYATGTTTCMAIPWRRDSAG